MTRMISTTLKNAWLGLKRRRANLGVPTAPARALSPIGSYLSPPSSLIFPTRLDVQL